MIYLCCKDLYRMDKHFFVLVLLSLFFYPSFSQLDKNYIAAPIQDTIPTNILTRFKAKLERDKSGIPETRSNVKGFAQELYDKRCEYVIENFNSDYFIVDTEFTPYLQKILNHIYLSNPRLPSEASVFAYRSEIPNAMSFGEGTIGFTLGLLSKLETEDQIAFVLCHELAHYQARHSDTKLMEFATLNYDKDIRKKLRAIKRSEYGSFTKFKEIANSLHLSMAKHSRDKEFEADSIALLLYVNTQYDLHEPLRALALLDSADVNPFQENIDLKKYFAFAEYPFKDHWLTYEQAVNLHQTSEENDSLQTHPQCKARMLATARQLSSFKKTGSKHVIAHKNLMREKSYFEIIESAYHFRSYGRALFNALLIANRYPQNIYTHAMIGKCLFQLYVHQKNHELGKVLVLPDPRFDDNYNRFLTFIHSLRLMELASLSYHYIAAKKNFYNADEEFLYAYWLCSTTEVSKDSPREIQSRYLIQFPKGKYAARMH